MPTAGVRRITLLTDFGTADGYVAAMKGVIAAILPAAIIDDASHEIAPGDIRSAAWALAGYWRLYPPDTIHVVVVDPGVGGPRRALVARIDDRFFVGPDNGVLTPVLVDASSATLVEIDPSLAGDVVSATFHGRDLFAPAAARLAGGVDPAVFGPTVFDPVMFDVPRAVRSDGGVEGVIMHVDRFGNLITNIPAHWVDGTLRVCVSSREVPVGRTYADVEPGQPIALAGSRGLLEIAVREGSAATTLAAAAGDRVVADAG
jgi:S-adenosyl-L-methionine hydrolase (adenosine-forming)